MTCTNIAPEMNIKPEKNRDSIRIRFRFDGRDYFLAPFPKSSWNDANHRKLAESIAYKIEIDIISGNFDPSLNKYRSTKDQKKCTNSAPKVDRVGWLEIFLQWQESRRLLDHTKKDHYFCCQRMIEKAGFPEISDISWLVESRIATSTFNRRLSMLRSAINLALSKGQISFDPLNGIINRQADLEEQEKIENSKKPFSIEEIDDILGYFKKNHLSYLPFVEFLLFSGVRTGEAVGLRWKDINLNKKIISIKQNIVRDRGKYQKIRKSPKTRQSIRNLVMNDRLYKLFCFLQSQKKILPEDLIFKSPQGMIIDHGNFRRIWAKALSGLGIEYRKPYTTRHTLISHALENGTPMTQVAAIAGHKNTRMIIEHYAHSINPPQLPDI